MLRPSPNQETLWLPNDDDVGIFYCTSHRRQLAIDAPPAVVVREVFDRVDGAQVATERVEQVRRWGLVCGLHARESEAKH